ncbi:MAG: ATP-binding protein, partial [Planctomycetota bacterium]
MNSDNLDEKGLKAEQASLLSRVAGGLAHEIKNPLSTMAIHLALLQEEFERAAQARDPEDPELNAREKRCNKRVATLQREIRRLELIVEDFLVYARGGVINRAPTDLVSVVREVMDFVELEDQQAGIRHHLELPVSLPLVMLDESAFRQALLNLCVNARQAMPDGGELIVQVKRDGGFVEILVTDTGVGIPETQQEKIFEEYWSSKKGGTGLGLATVKRVVEQHRGTIG